MVLCRVCREEVEDVIQHMGKQHPDYSKTIANRSVARSEQRSNRRCEKTTAAFVRNLGYSLCFIMQRQQEMLTVIKDTCKTLDDLCEKYNCLEQKIINLTK